MFLTKKHLSRRTVLKGAGVSLALPLLDAMIPAATALSQTAAAPKLRSGFFYIPHGAIMGNTSHGPQMDKWTPSGAGADFKLSPDHEVAGTLQEICHLDREPREQSHGGRSAQPRPCNLALRTSSPMTKRRAPACPRLWTRLLPAISVKARLCRRWNWLRRRRFRWLPAAERAAITARRFRSATPPRRCRWNSIRARSSSSFLAKAITTRNGTQSRGKTSAFSIGSMIGPGRYSATWIRATALFWTAI